MQMFTIKLVRNEDVANGTKAFIFEKPGDFNFAAGQYIRMVIPDLEEPDPEGNDRKFSIAAAPEDEWLRFASRMRGTPFKNRLAEMKPGETVDIEGPMGSLILPSDPTIQVVFLSGGIGITPFISMARHASKAILNQDITMFYSNKTLEDGVFMDELSALEKENPNFHVVNTMTDLPEENEWSGERGYIDAAMLERHLQDVKKPVYYIAGPPAMVAAMQKVLHELNVPEMQIRTEEFTGY